MRALVLSVTLLCAAAGPGHGAPEEPVRVATLLTYVADALDQLAASGAAVSVVASVPVETGAALPPGRIDLGSPHSPSFEQLAAARADVVVGDRRFHAALEKKLARVAGRVVLVEASSVETTYAGLRQVAEAAGVALAMEELIAESRNALASLRLRRARTVLPLFGAPGSYMAITGRTWLGDLLGELGFRNLAADLAGRESFPGYVEISEEVLATLRPDAVLLVTHGSPEAVAEDFRRQAEEGGPWAHLARRARVLDPALFARNPGLDLPRAARALVREAARAEAASAP